MITQYSICFLILLLSWSKYLTLSPATLELFLHNLKQSKLEKTAAFSAARTGPEGFLIFSLSPLPYPLSLAFGFLCAFVLTQSPVNSSPTRTMCCTVLPFPCWRNLHTGKGRKNRFQPSAFLSVCLEHCLASPALERVHLGPPQRQCLHNRAGHINISNI